MLAVVRDTGYVQWDPVNVVAPTHEIAFWSRIGPYRREALERLIWKDRKLFQGWGHAASLLLTEDYPLHYSLMRRYPDCLSNSWGRWRRRARAWIPRHRALRRAILRALAKGPKTVGQFPLHAKTRWRGDAWSSGSDVSEMLFHLWMGGDVMVAGHEGRANLWALTKSFLPKWAQRELRPTDEVERALAERALRALGVASRTEINISFPNGHYRDLTSALEKLLADSVIVPVRVEGQGPRDERYIHRDDLSQLQALAGDRWEPRTTILSPFDNLVCLRGRVQRLFGFEFAHENYVPREKRKYGVYVMPILRGDRFVGRVAPRMDRENRRLIVEGLHAEAGGPEGPEVGRAVAEQLRSLAHFLGADDVVYPAKVPEAWRTGLG